MKYTDYLSAVIRIHGVPRLSEKGFQNAMNVVHLEARCKQLSDLEEIHKNEHFVGKFKYDRERLEEKIKMITKGKTPQGFLVEDCEP